MAGYLREEGGDASEQGGGGNGGGRSATALGGLRVASLLPAATEIVAALGAEECLVGISHECDYPPAITGRPRLTWSPIEPESSSAEIDEQVRGLQASGRPVIVVDGPALRAARPDVVLTQDLCDVCAVFDGDVRDLARAIDPPPAVLPLTARTLHGIFSDIRSVARALRRERAAPELVAGAELIAKAIEGVEGDGLARLR